MDVQQPQPAASLRRAFLTRGLSYGVGLAWLTRLPPRLMGSEETGSPESADGLSAAGAVNSAESGWTCSGTCQPSEGVSLGNAARLLSDDSTSLLHRLELIDSATTEVLLSAYEVGDCQVSLRLLGALRSAAWRGVTVKLLVDGHGTNNRMPKPLMQYLIQQGVAIGEHQPDVRYKLEIGRQRMHDKLLIVDGRHLVVGGRNLRADYYGMSHQFMREQEDDEPIKDRWDRDAYLRGPVARLARQYYLARWHARTSGQPSLDRREKKRTRQAQQLARLNDLPDPAARACAARLLDQALATPLPWSSACCQQHTHGCECETFYELEAVRFLHDFPEHPKDCPKAIAHQLNCAISGARSTLLMETPYLIMTRDLRRRLTELRQRGVAVCLLTNSLQTNDKTIAHAQYANERVWMIAAGIELWEMKGDRQLHAKSLVIDGRRSMIGSYNFDVLSETRNSETAVLIDSPAFAAGLTRKIGMHLLSAIPVSQPLLNFDTRTNDVQPEELREARIKRLISPWIKRYL